MARENFERELHSRQDDILVLGSLVEQAVLESIDCLRRRDTSRARIIYDNDCLINEKRFEIESNCLILIATQQPMARDLRVVAAILEINTELERIGDYAKGIAKITLMLGDESLLIPITDFSAMAEQGLDMLHRALSAFVGRNAEAARAIAQEDDRIDQLYNQVYRDLIQETIQYPDKVDSINHLVWVAHNLERLGDRVTNICERIVFVATGEMRELDAFSTRQAHSLKG